MPAAAGTEYIIFIKRLIDCFYLSSPPRGSLVFKKTRKKEVTKDVLRKGGETVDASVLRADGHATMRVRSPLLPQTPRDVQRAIPVSRQNHLLRSLARWGAKAHPKEKFMKKMGEARVNHQTETASK